MKLALRLLLLTAVAVAFLGFSAPRTAKAYSDDDNLLVTSASCDSVTHTVVFTGIIQGSGNAQAWEYDDFGVYPNDDDYYPPFTGVGPAGSSVTLTYTDATAFVLGAVVNFLGPYDTDEVVLTVPCTPRTFAGPSVPSGFVLRIITCDVAVFNLASGTALPTGERIKAGQTWYVNPKSVSVANNALYPKWTEIFNSGLINGYIPTACVGGKPAGYTGE